MRILFSLVIILACLSANAQLITPSEVTSTIMEGADQETYLESHLPEFHLMYFDRIYGDKGDVSIMFQRLSSLFYENAPSEILYHTVTPSGHEMTISKVGVRNTEYAILSAFRKKDGKLFKEFEYIMVISEMDEVEMSAIDSGRDLWMQHSNNNRPDLVVNEVYAKDVYYLNRGNLLNSRESIIDEYSYMLNPGWEIQLEEQGVLQINNKTILEIGTYANGQGQYLLIWRLQEDGSWKIGLDFNF